MISDVRGLLGRVGHIHLCLPLALHGLVKLFLLVCLFNIFELLFLVTSVLELRELFRFKGSCFWSKTILFSRVLTPVSLPLSVLVRALDPVLGGHAPTPLPKPKPIRCLVPLPQSFLRHLIASTDS